MSCSPSPPASLAEIRGHSRFEAAFDAFVDEMADVYSHNSRLRGLGDFRQGVCFQLLVCFDASRDPADPATLFTTDAVAAAMAMMGVEDKRAVSDLVKRLRDDGYATIERAAHDGRVLELRATDKAREIDREWLQVTHRPLWILYPEEERFRLGATRDSLYQHAFRAVSLLTLPEANRVMSGHPDINFLVQQTLGARIMMTLMRAVRERSPPRTDPGFYTWAAERCGVSPPHIRKVMRSAEERGLVALSGDHAVTVEVEPKLAEAVRDWTAACLSCTDNTSRHAWRPGPASVAGPLHPVER